MKVRRVKISAKSNLSSLKWAIGMDVSLPTELLHQLEYDSQGCVILDKTAESLAKNSNYSHKLRLKAAYTPNPPLSSRLPFSYHYAPTFLRQLAARGIGRIQFYRKSRWANFPNWPLDLSVDLLSDLEEPSQRKERRTPVILTHDLDTPEGVTNAAQLFAPIEEKYGARSVNFIVPCSWPIDQPILKSMQEKGHEIGVHGYDHANKTPFASPQERYRRLEAAQAFALSFNVTGYRAPSLLRTHELIQDLANRYIYDSSIPTSGGLYPTPNNGCATARPFKLNGIAELPLSLPRDGSLRFLGYTAESILKLWIDCTERIARSGGVVVLLTHCESVFSGNKPMLDIYQRYLRYIAESEHLEFSLPYDVLRNWKVIQG